MLYGRDSMCCFATMAGTTKKRDTAEPGCHLVAARGPCVCRTFSTHIKKLSITSNIYLVPGVPGKSIGLLLKRTYYMRNVHMMCAVRYSSVNSQYLALGSFDWLAQRISIPGTSTVYRAFHPTMATFK